MAKIFNSYHFLFYYLRRTVFHKAFRNNLSPLSFILVLLFAQIHQFVLAFF